MSVPSRSATILGLDLSLTSAQSIVFKLILGGVYAQASLLALSAALSLGLAAVLEVPTGYLADKVGCKRAVRFGYFFCGLASLMLAGILFALETGQTDLAKRLIILEAILDALGSSLVSGARDVLIYKNASKSENSSRNALVVAEFGSRYIALFSPVLFVTFSSVLTAWGHPSFAFLVLAVGWFSLVRIVGKFEVDSRAHEVTETLAKNTSRAFIVGTMSSVVFVTGSASLFAAYVWDTYAPASTYMLLVGAVDGDIFKASVLVVSVFAFSQFVRATLMRSIVKRAGSAASILVGALSLAVLTFLFTKALGAISLTGTSSSMPYVLLLVVSVPLFRLFQGLVSQPVIELLIRRGDGSNAATILSLRNMFGSLIFSFFSLLVAIQVLSSKQLIFLSFGALCLCAGTTFMELTRRRSYDEHE